MKEANDLANHQSPRIQNPRKRKRQSSESISQPGQAQPHHSAHAPTSLTNHLPTVYDQLSETKLTRQALKEFDRRNNLSPEPLIPTAPALVYNPTEDLPTRFGEIPTELQRFARKGGPDLSGLKGFPQPVAVTMGGEGSGRKASQTSSQASSKRKRGENRSVVSTATVTAYDETIMAMFEAHNFHTQSTEFKPSNYAELMDMMKKPHPTHTGIMLDEAYYTEFDRAIQGASSESKVNSDVLPYFDVLRRHDNLMDRVCSNWAPLWDKSPLSAPVPDLADGISIFNAGDDYELLRAQLDRYIVPIHREPFLSNFFLEFKRPMADAETGARQAQHDGAVGLRGIAHTRILNGENINDEKAVAFSATYVAGTLALYAHFLKRAGPSEKDWHYHMCRLDVHASSGSLEKLVAAARAFRNLRDYAAEIRIKLAKEVSVKLRQMEKLPPKPIYFLTLKEAEAEERRKAQGSKNKKARGK